MIRYAVLGLLREQPDYGYRLKRRFDDRVGSLWHLNVGQVYQTLRTLQRTGLIREVGTEQELGSPERRLFEITPKGRRLVERWCDRPPTRPRPVRDETLIRLLLFETGRRVETLRHVVAQEHLYVEHMARLSAQKRELAADRAEGDAACSVTSLALENAILHTEAHVRWLERCRQYLAEEQGIVPSDETNSDRGRRFI